MIISWHIKSILFTYHHLCNNEDTSSTSLYGLAGNSEARLLGSFLSPVVHLFECSHPCSTNMPNIQWIGKEQLRFLSAYFTDFSIIFCLANVKLSGAMNSDLKYIRINKSEQHVFQSTYILCFYFESDEKGDSFIQSEIEPSHSGIFMPFIGHG